MKRAMTLLLGAIALTGVSANAATIVGAAQQAGDFITLLMACKAAGVDKALPRTIHAVRAERHGFAAAARATARRPPRPESRRRSFAAAVDRQRHAGGGTGLAQASGLDTDGAGFARVSVIDARGARDRVLVRLE